MSAPSGSIDVTLASAGTGKTTFLVDRLVDAIVSGVPPEKILVTTFTISAADELVERCRARLIAAGHGEKATNLLQARVGTTHAVCGGLARDFAFELGLSPGMTVLSETAAATVFIEAADAVIAGYADQLNALSQIFGGTPATWRDTVRKIVDLARANAILAETLATSADRSTAEILDLLPAPEGSAAALDDELADAVRQTLAAIEGVSLKADTRDLVTALRVTQAHVAAASHVPWPLWAELAQGKAAKADATHFEGVREAAHAHAYHPRLRQDIETYVRQIFACATESIGAYDAHKQSLGLIDFVDQERMALAVLQRDDAAAILREEIDLVLVDELQDAAPIEVAIYTALARIASSSLWVGDLKQSIFGFRGGDAHLVKDAVDAALEASGRPLGLLSTSYRSRPRLCAFINDLFAPAFDAAGFEPGSSRFTGFDSVPDGLARNPLHVWFLTGRTRPERARTLALAVAEMLENPGDWPVRIGDTVRPLEPRDVAILCRQNIEVGVFAAALATLGIAVAYEQDDLLSRPEAELVLAAMRWIADRGDRLALVEMARLVGGEDTPDAWLEALGTSDPEEALLVCLPFASVLIAIRARRLALTPLEILDAVILETGFMDLVARWGTGEARHEVLDTLRGRAAAYLDACRREKAVATLTGLIAALAATDGRRRAGGANAVTITTVHRAKGGEWAACLLASLETDFPPRPGDPVVEAEGPTNWADPLAGRWVRFWPRPYASRTAGVPLHAAMLASAAGKRAASRARAEALRLLYVACTRARDYLILTQSSAGIAWLGTLELDDEPRVRMPSYQGRPFLVDQKPHEADFRVIKAVAPQRRPVSELFLPEPRAAREHLPLRLRPSDSSGVCNIVERTVGSRLPITGRPSMIAVGQAFHAYFAVDDPKAEGRPIRAAQILSRWGVAENLSVLDLLVAADRLWAFLHAHFPGRRWRREVPIFATHGSQQVSGRIDLLGDAYGGFVIVDHKAFPGRVDDMLTRAATAASQLEVYAQAMTAIEGGRCDGLFVYLPILGRIAEVEGYPRDTRLSEKRLR